MASSFSPVMSDSSSPSLRPPRSPTPSISSNDSWDMSIRRLSSSLSKICRSPSTSCGDLPGLPDDFELHDNTPPLPHHHQAPPPALAKPRPTRRSLDETASRCRVLLSPRQDRAHASALPDLYAEVSMRALYIGTIGRMCKKLRMRHEQSRKKLHEQLALICSGAIPATRTAHLNDSLSVLQEENKMASNEKKLQRPVIRRESMKKGLKLDVDIGSARQLYQTCVKISPTEKIEILNLPGFETIAAEPISPQTASNTDIEKIMCVMDDAGVLYIKQYPKKYLSIEYPQHQQQQQQTTTTTTTSTSTTTAAAQYLPIMQQDDAARTWRLVFYIPGCYDTAASRVLVKTIDDKLVICWRDCGENKHRDNGDNSAAAAAAAGWKLSMDLPHNVLTRSVSGVVTEDNQLVVEALLSAARDRCSSF